MLILGVWSYGDGDLWWYFRAFSGSSQTIENVFQTISCLQPNTGK
jgi:hypothetical protein